MLDGSVRSALDFSSIPIEDGKLFMIGLAKDIGRGKELVYQMDCKAEFLVQTFYHGCDTLKGSSASLLAKFEVDVMTFRGLHTSGTEDIDLPPAKLSTIVNVGTSSDQIRRFMDTYASQPDQQLLIYELQWLLTQAGCYSGKLANQWGPETKSALAEFTAATRSKLPGTEPSTALLAAVAQAVPETTIACQ